MGEQVLMTFYLLTRNYWQLVAIREGKDPVFRDALTPIHILPALNRFSGFFFFKKKIT